MDSASNVIRWHINLNSAMAVSTAVIDYDKMPLSDQITIAHSVYGECCKHLKGIREVYPAQKHKSNHYNKLYNRNSLYDMAISRSIKRSLKISDMIEYSPGSDMASDRNIIRKYMDIDTIINIYPTLIKFNNMSSGEKRILLIEDDKRYGQYVNPETLNSQDTLLLALKKSKYIKYLDLTKLTREQKDIIASYAPKWFARHKIPYANLDSEIWKKLIASDPAYVFPCFENLTTIKNKTELRHTMALMPYVINQLTIDMVDDMSMNPKELILFAANKTNKMFKVNVYEHLKQGVTLMTLSGKSKSNVNLSRSMKKLDKRRDDLERVRANKRDNGPGV